MIKTVIALLLCSITLPGLSAEIALSFDDAPMGDSAAMTGKERTKKLIAALQKEKVEDVWFFCNTAQLNDAGKERLAAYLAAGHHLANHSHSHLSANKLSVNDYLDEVKKTDSLLRSYDNFIRYHRFPYLHYGKDKQDVEILQKELLALGYRDGYVTVDNYDFYLNHLLNQSIENKLAIDFNQLRELYVDTLWDAIVFYDTLAKKYLGRSPKHILLLHENDTSALFIGDLIQKIRREGWTLISPQRAYSDPIAQQFPNAGFHKQGRVAGLAYDMGATEEELRHRSENTDYLDAQFKEKVLTKPQ